MTSINDSKGTDDAAKNGKPGGGSIIVDSSGGGTPSYAYAKYARRDVVICTQRLAELREIHAFQARIDTLLRTQHSLFRGASNAELLNAAESVETFVMGKLYTRLFQSSPRQRARDAALGCKLAALRSFLTLQHLDAPVLGGSGDKLLSVAQHELYKMNQFKTPRDKLVALMNCARLVSKALAASTSVINADAFLPVFIYVVVHSRCPNLLLNAAYALEARHPARLAGEFSYYLTHLHSVLSFVRRCDAAVLSIDAATYAKHMAPYQAQLDALQEPAEEEEKEGQKEKKEDEAAATPALPLVGHDLTMSFVSAACIGDLRVGQLPELLAEYQRMAKLILSLQERNVRVADAVSPITHCRTA
jgi:hypothetical protein